MKYPMRLCIKRVQDVVLEAKDENDAMRKAQALLETELKGPDSTQIEWFETDADSNKDFGKLPKHDSSKNIAIVYLLAKQMHDRKKVVMLPDLCKLADEKGVENAICNRILNDYNCKWKFKLDRGKR